jgi:hypothetical protein
MKELLEKIKAFQSDDPQLVEKLISYLGESPSISALEAVVSHYKAELKEILTKDLLEWMQENDMTTFENEDMKVSISTYVSAKVLEPETAFNWLMANQYGDLIKDTVDFPKGEFTDEIQQALEAMGASYTKKSAIHPQSLKKIMADRLKSGENLPDEDQGIKISYYDECKVRGK